LSFISSAAAMLLIEKAVKAITSNGFAKDMYSPKFQRWKSSVSEQKH
jgi:hypothetical protein